MLERCWELVLGISRGASEPLRIKRVFLWMAGRVVAAGGGGGIAVDPTRQEEEGIPGRLAALAGQLSEQCYPIPDSIGTTIQTP